MTSGPLVDLVAEARDRLAGQTDTPHLDAQLIMMNTLGQTRAWLLAHGDYQLNHAQATRFAEMVDRCADGEPLPYVLGWWEFYGRKYFLSPEVLIPRPETELLVEVCLARLSQPELAEPARVLEVGCGSGCVIATLALENPGPRYVATDLSGGALETAGRNREYYRLEQEIDLIRADLTRGLVGAFDLILANLPYIPEDVLPSLRVAQREPLAALNGGRDGLEQLRRLVSDLPRLLAAGGLAVLELDPGQFDEVEKMAARVMPGCQLKRYQDLAGRNRVLAIERRTAP